MIPDAPGSTQATAEAQGGCHSRKEEEESKEKGPKCFHSASG